MWQMDTAKSKPTAPRTELMEQISTFSESGSVYIYAPAGYGKSFSVMLWAENSAKPYVRVALTEDIGANPALFYESLADALLKLQKGNKRLHDIVKHPGFSNAPVEFFIRALNAWDIDGESAVFIIDDFHLVTNPGILKKYPELISLHSKNITLFILSRNAPSGGFSSLIVKESIAVMDASPLLFQADEIQALFSDWGYPLTKAQAEDIFASTGGWAIGVKTILLSGGQLSIKKLLKQHWESFIEKEVWDK